MYLTSLLVVSSVFSCLALVISLMAWRRYLDVSRMERAWKQVQDAYTIAAKEFQTNYARIDGELDRLRDQFELSQKAFKRFRSRVTMQERRSAENEKEDETPQSERPWTEAEKEKVNLKLFQSRYGNKVPGLDQE